LKGHFVPTRHAANYWPRRPRPVIPSGRDHQQSSTSGLLGKHRSIELRAAKAGIAAFTVIIAEELGRYGVRATRSPPRRERG